MSKHPSSYLIRKLSERKSDAIPEPPSSALNPGILSKRSALSTNKYFISSSLKR